MPQGSVSTSLDIANEYRTTSFDLSSLNGSLCAGLPTWSSGTSVDMDSMQYVLAGSQQAKLTGTGVEGVGYYGTSATISADGNTIAIGAPFDGPGGDEYGSVFIYTRSGTTWTQQARILCPNTYAHMGSSVALSSDGNTLAAGAETYNSSIGGVFIYTRSGTTWTQQGSVLVGTGYVSTLSVAQGSSVALSADGNTLAVSGAYDNSNVGATWVFTRSGTTWSQQGSKLVGTGGVGQQYQGSGLALSADGNTLAVGAFSDNSQVGATWIFTRSGTTWSQQGSKLVGTGSVGIQYQGIGVSLSASGDTLAVGGGRDNSNIGAVWMFTRSGTTWSQQGSKLTPTGYTGTPRFGSAVSISADGNVLAIGAYENNSLEGATWVFTRTNTTWTQQYSALFGTGGSPSYDQQGYAVAISKDGNTFVTTGASATHNAWVFA